MHTYYRVTTHIVEEKDTEKHISYGIEAYITKNGKFVVLDCIPDVFMDLTRAENFVKLCNEKNLSIEHFRDTVQDIVEDEYIVL